KQVARMMTAGFVHGVLNTDNMNVTGECFDYGPWRFLPTLDPGFTAAYFDRTGLYAFARQPESIYWNLAALADALRPLSSGEKLKDALDAFPSLYASAFADAVADRLGVERPTGEAGELLASDLFAFLHETQLPFERVFFDLFGGAAGREKRERSPHEDRYKDASVVETVNALAPLRPGRLDHSVFSEEPPLLLIDDVEAVWEAIASDDDWSLFDAKIASIRAYGAALDL
ncbi:MAG: protein adenylyltransferase SelO family protein, partial [Planctomycetota bacterium]